MYTAKNKPAMGERLACSQLRDSHTLENDKDDKAKCKSKMWRFCLFAFGARLDCSVTDVDLEGF
jgi:hypothetical protein